MYNNVTRQKNIRDADSFNEIVYFSTRIKMNFMKLSGWMWWPFLYYINPLEKISV